MQQILLKIALQYIENKKQAWEDLHELIEDKNENVRTASVFTPFSLFHIFRIKYKLGMIC